MATRDDKPWPLARAEPLPTERSETSSLASLEREETLVVGTTNLYENGQLRLIPVGSVVRLRRLSLVTDVGLRCQHQTRKVGDITVD